MADITDVVDWSRENVLAVMTDNSNDPSYPPGKKQEMLDYTYFGGIYRDCWLVAHDRLHITDPNVENTVAGGGLFVSYNHVSDASAEVRLQLQVRNERGKAFSGVVEYQLLQPCRPSIASHSKSPPFGRPRIRSSISSSCVFLTKKAALSTATVSALAYAVWNLRA